MSRTERFGFVLNADEKEVITQLAELEGGLSQAALVRALVRQAAFSRGLWPPGVTKSNKHMLNEKPEVNND